MANSSASKDKDSIVNPLNAYLQSESIGTWLDSFEIDYGDNIYLKVNEGIEVCDVGLFVLTDNFFDKSSGWPVHEFSTFFMEMMNRNKEIILINAGVSPTNMHTLMKTFKYLTWNGLTSLPEIGNAIKRKLSRKKVEGSGQPISNTTLSYHPATSGAGLWLN